MEYISAAEYVAANASDAQRMAKRALEGLTKREKAFIPQKFKMDQLFEPLNRGARSNSCKVCGTTVDRMHEQHLKWHNVLNKVLSGWVPE